VAGFDGGAITSNWGALLLGATDRAITLVSRFAGCLRDARMPEPIEHDISCPRFLWTPIRPRRDRNDGVQHDEDRSPFCRG
jgi:hypothetical protein